MITWKRTGIFLFVTMLLIICYFAFLAPPPYYMQEGGFLERSGSKFGTGVPYNQLNTSGRFVKQNPYSYWYIYKGGKQPGIYKESAGGIKSVRLTDNSARYMNLYLDETTGEEWIYYIDDDNNLWRVNDSGSLNELILNDCLYIFIIGNQLYYTTNDYNLYIADIEDINEIKSGSSHFLAKVASPIFAYYDDYELYYESPSPSGTSSISCLFVEYPYDAKPDVICSPSPDNWHPFYSFNLLYIDNGNLCATYGDTKSVLYENIPDDSRVYYAGIYIFFEGVRENDSDTYPLYRINMTDGKNLKQELVLDNIPCELYFFEGYLYQYDTEKGDLHRIYRLNSHLI